MISATSNQKDIALLIMRIVFGFSMIYGHGFPKLQRMLSSEPIEFSDPFSIGPVASLALVIFAEVLCAFLLTIGLFTRWAAIPLIITMLVAVFYAHLDDPFSKMEKGILFLSFYIAILISGPGWYSIDDQFRNR
jgi:putative oxidoreductase